MNGRSASRDRRRGGGIARAAGRPAGLKRRTRFVLAHASWFGGGNTPREPGGPTRNSLVNPDIDATYETLKARGVKFEEPVAVMPWGMRAAWCCALDGNEFFLVAA